MVMSPGAAADAEPATRDIPNTIMVTAQNTKVFLIEYLLFVDPLIHQRCRLEPAVIGVGRKPGELLALNRRAFQNAAKAVGPLNDLHETEQLRVLLSPCLSSWL